MTYAIDSLGMKLIIRVSELVQHFKDIPHSLTMLVCTDFGIMVEQSVLLFYSYFVDFFH